MRQPHQEQFFQLLRQSMGLAEQEDFEATDEDWQWLHEEADRQSLTGVIYGAVAQLPTSQLPPLKLLLKLMCEVEDIKNKNELFNQESARLKKLFEETGRRTAILKGQANARLYPDKFSRQVGDIDIWVEGGQESVINLLISMGLLDEKPKMVNERKHDKPILTSHHVHLLANEKGVKVEVHFRPSSGNYLGGFSQVMPAPHTFTVCWGGELQLDQQYAEAIAHPVVCTTDRFNIHDMHDSWAFVSLMNEDTMKRNGKYVLTCARDYRDMTLYISRQRYYEEVIQRWVTPDIPIASAIRAACEAGMTMRDGMPLHAALVEKDGYGVVFLGPSGMGKSTQAKLWVEHQGADFIIGDRPGLRRIDGQWIGFGMPWDGKDAIKQQKQVPIRALISLEQAPENSIRRLTKQEAMMVLLNQVMMPMWDDAAMALLTPLMGQLATEIPFYHLRNLPNKAATELTYNTIMNDGT